MAGKEPVLIPRKMLRQEVVWIPQNDNIEVNIIIEINFPTPIEPSLLLTNETAEKTRINKNGYRGTVKRDPMESTATDKLTARITVL